MHNLHASLATCGNLSNEEPTCYIIGRQLLTEPATNCFSRVCRSMSENFSTTNRSASEAAIGDSMVQPSGHFKDGTSLYRKRNRGTILVALQVCKCTGEDCEAGAVKPPLFGSVATYGFCPACLRAETASCP